MNGGVSTLAWLDQSNLVAGCECHALKIIDIEKSYVVKQSILTNHKVAQCLDTSQANLILTGNEDSCIRMWDQRNSSSRESTKIYSGHERTISCVKFNA